MADKKYGLLRKIAIDILGVLMIIGSVLFGWLPGPGGIPLLLAGLGLLATNHDWAKRLLVKLQKDGERLADIVFKDNPFIMLLWDVLAGLLLVLAVIVFTKFTNNFIQATASVLSFLALGVFLGNRKRLKRITRKLKRKT